MHQSGLVAFMGLDLTMDIILYLKVRYILSVILPALKNLSVLLQPNFCFVRHAHLSGSFAVYRYTYVELRPLIFSMDAHEFMFVAIEVANCKLMWIHAH